MRRTLLASFALLLTACPSKDKDYERAMDKWATDMCTCCTTIPVEDFEGTQACIEGIGGEPEFPDHFLDAMMTNPNWEINRVAQDRTRACCDRTGQ